MERAARRAPRSTSTGRCPATPTCSAPSRSTSATTCSPTSGCSCATARASLRRARGRARCRSARARWRASTSTPTARWSRASSASQRSRRTRSTRSPDRDFVLDYLAAAATCATHLSRLGAELVLWSQRGVRLLRAAGRVELGLLDHAAEEEPRRGRAAARQGAAGRRPPRRASRRAARAAADLQQGPAGGQGAPVRHRRHARADARGGQRDDRRGHASTASACARRPPTS